ncbi:MAG TPA: peptide chain release factor N(5)-glutamine methyltransferase [Solirubrobacteraceae bacterium]|nr:peptide chain release factor N(5)-glutamine methyltransferase [Solirubrobacteraceae bacterium]
MSTAGQDSLTASATVGGALAAGAARLAAAGCDSPRLDAELLLAAARGADRARLVIDRDARLGDGEARAYDGLLRRREDREPVAYILGRRDFRHLTLEVDARVLIPRPETELLVELALDLPAGSAVTDVGTGSGAIALALKHERPDLTVRGIDADPAAVELARANAGRLGLEVAFTVGDLLDDELCDAVLANLPYVAADAELPPEVARHEPPTALFSGPDGLELIDRLIAQLAACSPRPGLIALEIGSEQAPAVATRLRGAGFAQVRVHRDLAGHDRVVSATGAAA